MAASLEERSSGCCLCNFRALPLFDFGDGTDDFSKSSSELESESSVCDFLFLFDGRVSVVRTGELLSWGVLAEEDPPLLLDFFLDERVSVSRTCGLLSCGVLCQKMHHHVEVCHSHFHFRQASLYLSSSVRFPDFFLFFSFSCGRKFVYGTGRRKCL